MSYTAVTIFGKRAEERHEPWMTEDLARLCDSWGIMFQAILELAEEEGEDGTAAYVPAWGKLFNPNTVPYKDIPYLAQYVGVAIPKTATEAEARMLLKAEAGLSRGTRLSIEEAIKRIDGASEFFTIQERTNKAGEEEAYEFNVIVRTGKATTALKEAIEEVVPAGVYFNLIETKDSWLTAVKTWAAVAGGLKWSEAKEGNT